MLNGRGRAGRSAGAATRERILQVARERDYRLQRTAVNLRRGRTDSVALMMVTNRPEEPSPFVAGNAAPFLKAEDAPGELSAHYHEIIGGLTHALHQHGMHLTLARCGGPSTDPLEAMEQIARSRMCDGVVITDIWWTIPARRYRSGQACRT